MTSQAAGEILSQNMKTIYLWSLSKTSDSYKAEDLCSEIIIAVIDSVKRLRNDDAFFAFLWQVAANTYKVYLRKNSHYKYAVLDENESDNNDFADTICNAQQTSQLWRELSLLSEEYRKCTVAFYYDELSCSEISAKYGITMEMVKYYLFKSRKILKEGIAMERQFGEKSFKPSEFQFRTIYSGNYNTEYEKLFSRKLPGQILLSAYYEPMDVLQLSVELGVASVYLEDEIKLLTEYKMLKKIGTKKYQTDIMVISKVYTDTLYSKLDSDYAGQIGDIINEIRIKLDCIRKIGFAGCDLKENVLLWDIYVRIIMKAIWAHDKTGMWENIYDKVTGVNYIYDHNTNEDKYNYTSFAGVCTSDNGYKSSFIGFGVLSGCINDFGSKYHTKTEDESGSFFPCFTEEEIAELDNILADEIGHMTNLLSEISEMSVQVLVEHSPTSMRKIIEMIYPQINLFDICGWYGGSALNTNALQTPESDEYAGIIGYKKD